MNRVRLPSLTLVVTFLILTAGCLGVITGDEPLRLESDPVSVSASAAQDARYEEADTRTQTLEREFTAAGQTREAVVTNHIAEYSRSIDVEPLGSGEFARFVVVSTPAVEVLGQTFNPVGSMSPRELVAQVQDQYGGLQDVQSAGERSVSLLGEPATVSVFTAKAEVSGLDRAVDVTLHVVRIRSGSDFIVAIGVHPTLLDGEVDNIDTMLGGITHESG